MMTVLFLTTNILLKVGGLIIAWGIFFALRSLLKALRHQFLQRKWGKSSQSTLRPSSPESREEHQQTYHDTVAPIEETEEQWQADSDWHRERHATDAPRSSRPSYMEHDYDEAAPESKIDAIDLPEGGRTRIKRSKSSTTRLSAEPTRPSKIATMVGQTRNARQNSLREAVVMSILLKRPE